MNKRQAKKINQRKLYVVTETMNGKVYKEYFGVLKWEKIKPLERLKRKDRRHRKGGKTK